MKQLSYKRQDVLLERIYLRILAESQREFLIRSYVNEIFSNELLDPVDTDHKALQEKWSILDDYFHSRHLLSESRTLIAEGLLDRAWNGIKGMAKTFGKNLVDGAVWLKQRASKISKKAFEVLKKIGGNLQNIIIFAIKQLPGGEIVLEFLSEVGAQLKEKITEMRNAMGEKIKKWVESAKSRIVKLFLEKVLKDPESKKQFYAELGISQDDLATLRTETKIFKFNKRRLSEADDDDKDDAADIINKKIRKATGVDAMGYAQVLGIMEKKPDFDSEQFLRGEAARVIKSMVDFWSKLVQRDPRRWWKPFFQSNFFSTLGETGFGLASAAILGILGASQLGWKELVRYASSIKRGFAGGMDRPPGSTSNKAVAFLFLGNESNDYDASLFKSLVSGIVEGSNVELIVRAMAGDVTKVPELAKRILSTAINAVKEEINDATKAALAAAGTQDELIDDDTEEEVNEVVGEYVDNMFNEST